MQSKKKEVLGVFSGGFLRNLVEGGYSFFLQGSFEKDWKTML